MTVQQASDSHVQAKTQTRTDLRHFLYASPLPLKILTVDSSLYLPLLRELCPQAELTAVTDFVELPEVPAYAELGVTWHVREQRGESLQALGLAEGQFDYILAEQALASAYEPYDTLMTFSRLLTDTGTLLAAFPNVRYTRVLAGLQAGAFPVRGQHLWAKDEVVRLLNDTLFKEIAFVPGVQDVDTVAEQAFAAQGFADYSRDLATEVWLVRASRATAAVANLKGLYDKKTRAELARVLHRIEYDVEREKNLVALQELCNGQMIFPDYLHDFVESACIHAGRVLPLLNEVHLTK